MDNFLEIKKIFEPMEDKDNAIAMSKYMIKYYSDDRIIAREYEIV